MSLPGIPEHRSAGHGPAKIAHGVNRLAVPIEFANVIVRKAAVERIFSGGLDAFARQDMINNTFSEDDHLLRVSFMSTGEALAFASIIEAAGLRFLGPEAESDIACFDGRRDAIPIWLSVGSIDGHFACWANAYPVGELVRPEPGFMLRCPWSVYISLTEVVRECQAKIHQLTTDPEDLATFRCTRGDAEITIHVFGESDGTSLLGLFGWRQMARRSQFQAIHNPKQRLPDAS
jgi:hypothetical protein